MLNVLCKEGRKKSQHRRKKDNRNDLKQNARETKQRDAIT